MDGHSMADLKPPPAASDAGDGGAWSGAPLPIINGAVNLPGTRLPGFEARGVARFEMTPYYVGGPATGWAPTRAYGERMTLSIATAISAAAINTQGGGSLPRWLAAPLLALNLRLGMWLSNPKLAGDPRRFRQQVEFSSGYLIDELLGGNTEQDPQVFVSDGGHDDNLGITALFARGCRVVLSVDATADSRWHFSDLVSALALLLLDGWTIEQIAPPENLDQSAAWYRALALARNLVKNRVARELRPSKPGGSLGERTVQKPTFVFRCQRTVGNDVRLATLVYAKAALTQIALDDPTVTEFAGAHQRFPQEGTIHQWFTSQQFDAYVAVGRALADAVATKAASLAEWPGTDPRESTSPSA